MSDMNAANQTPGAGTALPTLPQGGTAAGSAGGTGVMDYSGNASGAIQAGKANALAQMAQVGSAAKTAYDQTMLGMNNAKNDAIKGAIATSVAHGYNSAPGLAGVGSEVGFGALNQGQYLGALRAAYAGNNAANQKSFGNFAAAEQAGVPAANAMMQARVAQIRATAQDKAQAAALRMAKLNAPETLGQLLTASGGGKMVADQTAAEVGGRMAASDKMDAATKATIAAGQMPTQTGVQSAGLAPSGYGLPDTYADYVNKTPGAPAPTGADILNQRFGPNTYSGLQATYNPPAQQEAVTLATLKGNPEYAKIAPQVRDLINQVNQTNSVALKAAKGDLTKAKTLGYRDVSATTDAFLAANGWTDPIQRNLIYKNA